MNLPAKLRQLASQENHDGEPYDSLIEAAAEIDRLTSSSIPICIGPPIIRILAEKGQWQSDNGNAVIAADGLFRQDPYSRIEELERSEHSMPKISEWAAFKHSTETFEWKMAIEGPDFTMFSESKSFEGLGRTFAEKVKEDADLAEAWIQPPSHKPKAEGPCHLCGAPNYACEHIPGVPF